MITIEIYTHRIHGAGIYVNIWGILMGSMSSYMVNVTLYSIHGSYGIGYPPGMSSNMAGWKIPDQKKGVLPPVICHHRPTSPWHAGTPLTVFMAPVVTEPRNEKERQSAVMVGNWRFLEKYDMFNTCSL